jgi:hypothetical protein
MLKLFTTAFCGLSSSLEILQYLSQQLTSTFLGHYQMSSVEDLLKCDQAFFFSNLFSKLQFSHKNAQSLGSLLLVIKSLSRFTPALLCDGKVVSDMVKFCIENIDLALLQVD